MRLLILAVAVGLGLFAVPRAAHAYPQFQLSRDQTCTSCHLSPAGGGLLSENGLSTAETVSQLGGAPELFHGKLPTPDWLVLGGDLRGAAGYMKTPENALAAFPMQIDVYAQATAGHLSLHVTAGPRPERVGAGAATYFWSREHYVQWQQHPGESTGLFVRAGRFMPVFGLRFAEHPMYTRRYGGTQLYAETYGVALEYIEPKWEVHATGFIKDPFIVPVERASGGAIYAETRLSEHVSIGAEAMLKDTKYDRRWFYGLTGKLYLPGPDLLLSAEGQFVNQIIDETDSNPAGGAPLQIIGNLVATKMLGDFVMLDLGIGHFDSNIRIHDLERDAVDLNLHYFLSSHTEIALNARYELMALGNDPAGAYALAQLHYRL